MLLTYEVNKRFRIKIYTQLRSQEVAKRLKLITMQNFLLDELLIYLFFPYC